MTTKPLSILLCSGSHEKIQMAAMMASIAAVSDRRASIFVSMNAIYSFLAQPASSERYSGDEFSKLMLQKGVPDAIDLFKQGKELGELSIFVCSMALDVTEFDIDDMIPGLFDDVIGLTKFLSDAEEAQLVVI